MQHDELDEEHDECCDALNLLSAERTASSLVRFLDVFERHCAHEEALLERHLYAPEEKRLAAEGGVSMLLNSRTSHFKDHARVIGAVKQELARAAGEGSSVVSVGFVNGLLRDFENHANVYDASYADKLAAEIGRYI